MAKISIVKWSQKWNFVYGSAISGIPKYFENCWFQCNLKILGWPKKGISVHKNPFLRSLYKRYFCQITIVKWSRIIQKSVKKCNFWDIFILGPFSIKFPTVTLDIYQHWKEKSYRGSRDSFGNGMTRVTTWEGVEVATVQITNQRSPYYGIFNTHGIDLNSWYSIGTPESHTYEGAECYPYAGFFLCRSKTHIFEFFFFVFYCL